MTQATGKLISTPHRSGFRIDITDVWTVSVCLVMAGLTLEWDKRSDDEEWYSYDYGNYGICDYIVYRSPVSSTAWCLKVRGHLLDEDFASADEAKAAAQANYERRILSALSHHPAQVDANASAEARLREAFDEFIDSVVRDVGEAKRKLNAELPNDGPVHPVSAFLTRIAIEVGKVRYALSQHPHASDCAKQGGACACLQPGGDPLGTREICTPSGPSDRTADVMADELREWLLSKKFGRSERI
jgi:hypothetical protein